MAMCEKCWSDAGFEALISMRDKSDIYHRLLEERKDRPCYLDCPDKSPDHYSYAGCSSCGFKWGEPEPEMEETEAHG
jgi:hypothetical protein